MSYTFTNLDQVSKIQPTAGQRLMRVIFKKTENQKNLKSVCAMVPVVGIGFLQSVMLDADGSKWLQAQLESVQDKIARAIVVKGSSALRYEEIDSNAVLGWIRAQDISADRFTKELVGKWFNYTMTGPLSAQIHVRMPDISASQLATLLHNYMASFQLLAGRSPIEQKTKKQLVRAMELLDESTEDSITLEIMRRLTEDRTVTEKISLLDNL
jgi:hypothetical protein